MNPIAWQKSPWWIRSNEGWLEIWRCNAIVTFDQQVVDIACRTHRYRCNRKTNGCCQLHAECLIECDTFKLSTSGLMMCELGEFSNGRKRSSPFYTQQFYPAHLLMKVWLHLLPPLMVGAITPRIFFSTPMTEEACSCWHGQIGAGLYKCYGPSTLTANLFQHCKVIVGTNAQVACYESTFCIIGKNTGKEWLTLFFIEAGLLVVAGLLTAGLH